MQPMAKKKCKDNDIAHPLHTLINHCLFPIQGGLCINNCPRFFWSADNMLVGGVHLCGTMYLSTILFPYIENYQSSVSCTVPFKRYRLQADVLRKIASLTFVWNLGIGYRGIGTIKQRLLMRNLAYFIQNLTWLPQSKPVGHTSYNTKITKRHFLH